MDQKKDVEQSREGSLEETKHFKSSTPGILFFRIFAWSCRVLSATHSDTFFLTHSFWTSCKHIFWHSIWLILWHLATTSLTHSFCNYYQSFPSQLRSGTPHWTRMIAVGVRHATLNSQDRSWGPAHNTELTRSQLGSGTPHWTRRIAVGVRHATLNSQDRGWGPARHTELAGSRLGSGTPHWTHELAVGARHATLNSQDRSWDPTRRRTTGGGGGRRRKEEYRSTGEGGEETDIKSNNPHLTGGEKEIFKQWLPGARQFSHFSSFFHVWYHFLAFFPGLSQVLVFEDATELACDY